MARKIIRYRAPISGRNRTRLCRERIRILDDKASNVYRKMLERDEIESESETNFEINEQSKENELLRNKLCTWANDFFISKRALDNLLPILINAGLNSLPKNHRTLQKTPTNIQMNNIAGGKMWYNGIAKCLTQIFSKLNRNLDIKLNVNIDGLPLTKSSRITFYPILASIYGKAFIRIFFFSFNIN